jgi:hypothetical protein
VDHKRDGRDEESYGRKAPVSPPRTAVTPPLRGATDDVAP